jgi:hypothetical protein
MPSHAVRSLWGMYGLQNCSEKRVAAVRPAWRCYWSKQHAVANLTLCRSCQTSAGFPSGEPGERATERCLPTPLVQIQILSPVNHCARRSRPSRSALMVGRPRCDRYDDHRQRKNHREPKCEAIWFRCHLFPSGQPTEVPWRSLEAESGEMCELLHTLLPGINVTMLFRLARGGTG